MRQLYVFLEGKDDRRFFEHVLEGLFSQWHRIYKITYRGKRKPDLDGIIQKASAAGDSYIFFYDSDGLEEKARIDRICNSVCSKASPDHMVIVRTEIESWYAAMISPELAGLLSTRIPEDTERVTKESFRDMVPKGSDKKQLMIDILKRARPLDQALQKNKSLLAFYKRYADVSPPLR